LAATTKEEMMTLFSCWGASPIKKSFIAVLGRGGVLAHYLR
jgi:hypothetical protein